MDSLAGNLTKAISELLEQDEKRHVSHKSDQEKQAKWLETLEKRLETMEIKFEGIGSENEKLKEELKLSKTRNEELAKEMVDTKQELKKTGDSLKEFKSWVDLIVVIANQMNALHEWRDQMEEKSKCLEKGQVEIAKELRRLQQQLVANTIRPPVKSPSASSYLNSANILGTIPRVNSIQNSYHTSGRHKNGTSNNNLFMSSPDADEELNELSEQAESLRHGVEVLNNLHRSFNSYSYSDDTSNT